MSARNVVVVVLAVAVAGHLCARGAAEDVAAPDPETGGDDCKADNAAPTPPKKLSSCSVGIKCAKTFETEGPFRIYDQDEVESVRMDIPVEPAADHCCTSSVSVVVGNDGMPLISAADDFLCPEALDKFRTMALNRDNWETPKKVVERYQNSRQQLKDGKRANPNYAGRMSRWEPQEDHSIGDTEGDKIKNEDADWNTQIDQCMRPIVKAVYTEVGVPEDAIVSHGEPAFFGLMSGYNKAVWNNLWDRNSTAHIDKTGIGLGTVWSLTPNATYENCGEAIVKFKARKVDGEHWDPLLRVNGLNLPDARHKRGLWDKVRGAHFKSQLIKAKPGLKKKEMTNELRDHTLKFNLPSAVVVGMQMYNRVLLYEEATLHSAFLPPIHGPYSDDLWEGRLNFYQQYAGPVSELYPCESATNCEECYARSCGWCLESKRCIPDALDEERGCAGPSDHVGDAGDVYCNGTENERYTKRKANEAACQESLGDCKEDPECNLCLKQAMETGIEEVDSKCGKQDLWNDVVNICSGKDQHGDDE